MQIIHAFDHTRGTMLVSHYRQWYHNHHNCSRWDPDSLWDLLVSANLLRFFLNVGFTQLAPYGTLQVYNVTVRYKTRARFPRFASTLTCVCLGWGSPRLGW